MFSHDGHGNPALATPGQAKVKHSIYYQGVHGFGAGFEFAYQPGPVTNLALVTMGENQWRFVISEGEFIPFPPRPISAPADPLPPRRRCRSPSGATSGARRARRTTWPPPRDAGPSSSWSSPGCSASRRSSSDDGTPSPPTGTGLRDRPEGLRLGRRGGPAGRRGGRRAGRGARRERRLRPPGRRHPGRRSRRPATCSSSPSTSTPSRRAAGSGAVLAEAIRDAGAVGAMLNHSERPMTLGDIDRALARAREVGLATMVYADSPEEAAAVAMLGPDIVLAEPPELIATGRSAATEMRGVRRAGGRARRPGRPGDHRDVRGRGPDARRRGADDRASGWAGPGRRAGSCGPTTRSPRPGDDHGDAPGLARPTRHDRTRRPAPSRPATHDGTRGPSDDRPPRDRRGPQPPPQADVPRRHDGGRGGGRPVRDPDGHDHRLLAAHDLQRDHPGGVARPAATTAPSTSSRTCSTASRRSSRPAATRASTSTRGRSTSSTPTTTSARRRSGA